MRLLHIVAQKPLHMKNQEEFSPEHFTGNKKEIWFKQFIFSVII